MALAVSLLFLCFFYSIMFLALTYFERERESTIKAETFNLASTIADSIETKLKMVHQALIQVAAVIPPRTLENFDLADEFLHRQVALHSLFDNGLFLVRVDGQLRGESPPRPQRRGSDVSAREYFQKSIETRKPYISKPYRSTHTPGQPAVIMTAPIFSESGTMIGLLYGSFDLHGANLLADLAKVRIGKSGYVFLTAGRESIISHPDPSRVMMPTGGTVQNSLFNRAIDGFEGSGETTNSYGVRMLSSFKRIPSTGWILGANYPAADAYEVVTKFRDYFYMAMVAGTLLMLLAVWLLTRLLTRRLEVLTDAARRMGGGDMSVRTGLVGNDETAELSLAMDSMAQQVAQGQAALQNVNNELEARVQERTADMQQANRELEKSLQELSRTQNHLVQTEKMAALGGLVAGVAHEINTPVGIGFTAASHLDEKVKALAARYQSGAISREDLTSFIATASETTAMVMANLKRAAELIRSFKQVAVDQTGGHRRRFHLNDYLREVLRSLSPQLSPTGHQVKLECPDELKLHCNPGDISQIITNLVMNSLIHGFEGIAAGHIKIQVSEQPEGVLLRYSDDGKGIAAEHMTHIFEPFYTTKRGQGGSGLGLHVIYNIVTQGLGGSINCSSTPGQGVVFDIRIPPAQ